jgi:undecaprenyl-phosphate 4-deoxy-4-formamido-L-arabinose transferase
VLALVLIWIDKIWITRDLTLGISTVLGTVVLFSGVQLMILGVVGEYLGRMYLGHTRTPQYIVRYTVPAGRTSGAAQEPGTSGRTSTSSLRSA